jgi:hypothetical protein
MIDLKNVYHGTDLSGRLYSLNKKLGRRLETSTQQLATIGSESAGPPSLQRRWAVRALAAGAFAVLPALPLAALSVGPLALLAFGVGRDPEAPKSGNAVMRGAQTLRQYGLLGVPESAAVAVGDWAARNNKTRVHHVALSIAIGLSLVAQPVRCAVAAAGTGLLLTDGAAQLLVGLGLAACYLGRRWALGPPSRAAHGH